MRIVKSGSIWKFLDPGLLLVIALSLIAARPLLAGNGVYRGHDTMRHLFRSGLMERSWTQGEYFPSWAEDTNWGYGSPLFHFHGSLTYHITSALQFAFALNGVQALRWLLLFCCLICGAGMYLFCQRRSGRLGGLIGGAVYVNSPYLFQVNAQLRGAYPELIALTLFPILLWRIDALRDAPNARNFLLVALLEFALINTHNLSAALFTGIAFAWLAFEALVQRVNREASQLDRRGESWAALALAIGILSAASFWLPAIWERESVTLEAFLSAFDSENSLSVGELFNVPSQFFSFERPRFHEALRIGIAQWTFALAGVGGALALYLRGYRTRHPQAFLGAVFFFGLSWPLIFMMTPQSQPIWDSAPALRHLQFPWRLLGPVAVGMAYLASLNGLWLRRLPERVGQLAVALAVAAVIVAGFAVSRAIILSNQNLDFGATRQGTAKVNSATADNEFLPATASIDVDNTRLQADEADGSSIDKFDHESLPPGASATLLRNGPEAHSWRVVSPTPFEATILTYWWPGWTATVDGQPAPVAPSDPLGLITASLPAGDYTLRVYLGSTPARDIGSLVSALAFIAGLAFAWRLQRLRIMPRPYAAALPMTSSEIRGLLLGAAIVAVCFYLVIY